MKSLANPILKLRAFYDTHKRMPSYSELAQILGYKSKNAAQYVVEKWLEKGIVGKDRTGKLIPGRAFHPLKVLGTVAAGWPSPAEEEMVDTISLDEWLIENKEASFLLKVSGDSMIDAGIHEGDVVILERGKNPKNGDVVVAEVDHEWTIKFYEKKGAIVALVPANERYERIIPQEELRIAGVVTAVIRKY